jgi:putative spermidine/putrescine transport system substrate-binding protein
MAYSISRRKALTATLGGAVIGAAPYHFIRTAHAQSGPRVIVSGWGGAMQQAMRDCYFIPFTKATGIKVVEQTYGGQGLARVKSQLAEGAAQVDLLDAAPFWVVLGRKQNLLDKISLPALAKDDFTPGSIDEYAFGFSTISWGITYTRSSGKPPTCWRDFWDTKTFKGRRAFFGPFIARHPEYALMADGIAPSAVYPLDDAKIERAFRKLEELRPAINVWYQSAVQCEQLLLDQQVDMAEFFSGRAFYLKDEGVPITFVWDQALINTSMFVLARGAPNPDNAIKFLSFIAQPEPQAAFAKAINYGPTNIKAFDLITNEETLQRLPSFAPNLAKQIPLDYMWWGENQDRLAARWNRLMAG